jgi:hypothetical protein
VFEPQLEIECSLEMGERPFCDPEINLDLVLLSCRSSRLLKLLSECGDLLFEEAYVFTKGPLHLADYCTPQTGCESRSAS